MIEKFTWICNHGWPEKMLWMCHKSSLFRGPSNRTISILKILRTLCHICHTNSYKFTSLRINSDWHCCGNVIPLQSSFRVNQSANKRLALWPSRKKIQCLLHTYLILLVYVKYLSSSVMQKRRFISSKIKKLSQRKVFFYALIQNYRYTTLNNKITNTHKAEKKMLINVQILQIKDNRCTLYMFIDNLPCLVAFS